MKFLHLCTSIKGGAGRIPLNIHQECLKRSHQSLLLTQDKLSAPPDGVASFPEYYGRSISAFTYHIMSKFAINSDYLFFNKDERRFHLPAQDILDQYDFIPDVICSYWSSGAYNMATLRDLHQLTGAPIVFVLTDMAPYTGGCHYAWSGRGYKMKCDSCPAIKSRWFKSRASRNLKLKEDTLRDVDFEVIASSGQAIDFAKQSAMFKGRTIHENVHKVSSSLRVANKQADRRALNLPFDRVILLLAASDLTDNRKGGRDAIAALNHIYKKLPCMGERISILVVGHKSGEIAQQLLFETHCLPHVAFETELSSVLGASDLFISTSHIDTGPYMVNLAIYHNCPVVAYPIGVARFLIGKQRAGFLADNITHMALAQKIEKFLLLDEIDRIDLSDRCQSVAKQYLLWDDEFFWKLSCGKMERPEEATGGRTI